MKRPPTTKKQAETPPSADADAHNGNGNGESVSRLGLHIVIPAPNYQKLHLTVRGSAPYVQNAFSAKALEIMRGTQAEGSAAPKKKREKKDFTDLYMQSFHVSGTEKDPWHGIPANGIRASMVAACRTTGKALPMTQAKQAVWIIADGVDAHDHSTPLVRITKGAPHKVEHFVRLPNGSADVRVRAMWDAGWEAVVCVEYDADMLRAQDVANLLSRAGRQVGWGEGRPASKNSAGMGWGTFDVQ